MWRCQQNCGSAERKDDYFWITFVFRTFDFDNKRTSVCFCDLMFHWREYSHTRNSSEPNLVQANVTWAHVKYQLRIYNLCMFKKRLKPGNCGRMSLAVPRLPPPSSRAEQQQWGGQQHRNTTAPPQTRRLPSHCWTLPIILWWRVGSWILSRLRDWTNKGNYEVT